MLFDMPTILTTSVEAGPNGPLPKEILEMYPNTSVIRRPGEVNAWDNADVRAAVKATGRKQVILAGITTDVCVAFLALSLRAEGYDVFVNLEASGTFNERVAQGALMRMQAAGVQIMNLFSISAELFRDWRSTGPDGAQVIRYVDHYLPSEGFVVRAHVAAISSVIVLPGENATIALTNNDPDVFI
ncbi:hypothetical protein LTR86_003086 [Recurvomyces mirabilis]|nr:hypothetical protein LTR86_003086 [Recurvomyces mirabilis]